MARKPTPTRASSPGTQCQQRWLPALDARLSNRLFLAAAPVPRWAYKLLEYGGDGILWLALTFAALALPATPPAARAAWANFLLGLLIDLALVGTLKGTFRRSRPVYNRKEDFLAVVAVDHYSFPSGHSSRASFVAMFVLACLPQLGLRLRLGAVLWALTTALSRAAMGRHYLGDVVAGLAVGVLNTAILTKGTFTLAGAWLDERTTHELYSAALARLQPLLAAVR